jgi:hypothetical protein
MRRHYRLILQAALSCSLFSCSAGRTQGVTYPEPSTVIADGLSDPFAILKDPASQVTSDYIEAENQNYRGWFERRSSLKRSILREMMKWTDRPFERPLELGRFVYFGESVPGLRFPIIKRRGLSASESRTVLDPNRLLAKNPEASLFAFKPSPAGEMIAFTIHFPQLGTSNPRRLRARLGTIRSVRSNGWTNILSCSWRDWMAALPPSGSLTRAALLLPKYSWNPTRAIS